MSSLIAVGLLVGGNEMMCEGTSGQALSVVGASGGGGRAWVTVTLTLPTPLAVLYLLHKGQRNLCEGESRRRVGGPRPFF